MKGPPRISWKQLVLWIIHLTSSTLSAGLYPCGAVMFTALSPEQLPFLLRSFRSLLFFDFLFLVSFHDTCTMDLESKGNLECNHTAQQDSVPWGRVWDTQRTSGGTEL